MEENWFLIEKKLFRRTTSNMKLGYNNFKQRNKHGFTMAELLVASAIFMLFSGALFGLYRMGNKMYSAGTWRYTRQKQAELFFHVLKERIEQASSIVCINQGASGENQIVEAKDCPSFIVLDSDNPVSVGTDNVFLAEFVIGKPAIANNSTSIKKGLTLYHSFYLSKPTNSQSKVTVGNLCLCVRNSADLGSGCFKKTNWPPNTSVFSGLGANFSDDPANYSLNPVPHDYKLEDVASVEVHLEEYKEAKTDYCAAITFVVTMRNPKLDSAELKLTCSAKVDRSVKLEGRNTI